MVPLFLAAGVVAASAYTLQQEPEYRAESMVLLEIRGAGTVAEAVSGGIVSPDFIDFYADVIPTPDVLEPVISRLGLGLTASQLARRTDVQATSNTVVIRIGVRDSSGERAARIARAIAEQYRTVVANLAPKRLDGRPPVDVQLVSPTAAPWARVAPLPRVNLALGLIAGLAIGLAAFALLHRVSRPVSSRALVARVTDAPVIGTIIDSPDTEHRPLNVWSRLARPEAYRILRTTLRLSRPDLDEQCLVVTSSVHREGRSSTAVDLAISMANTARRVLLVDADIDNPALADLLRLDGSTGISQVLAGEAPLENTVRTWRTALMDHSVDLLPAGAPMPGAGRQLASAAMEEMLSTLRGRYDRIIIDTGPLLSTVDGAFLAARTDGALLLVDSQRTRQRQLIESVGRLEMAGATLVGVVLTRVPPPQTVAATRTRTRPLPAGQPVPDPAL
jgi:capsular exopolysaccharide synthesis family protein